MIRYIFFKELQAALLNKRLTISCLVLTVLMAVGGFVFEKRYIGLQREYEESVMQNYRNLEIAPNKQDYLESTQRMFKQYGQSIPQEMLNDFLKLHLNELVFTEQEIGKEPSKLSFIASGNGALPNGVKMDYFGTGIPENFGSFNKYFRPFIALDWANIILYFLSFVCLCFAYDAFSGERQNGTLKLMLSASVPRWKILAGKLSALWCILSAPVILGAVILLLMIQLSSDIMLSGGDYVKISVFLLFSFLFVGINILLFFGVSILTPRTSVSSVVCLLVWIVLVFILPDTAWLIAGKLSPVPGIDEQNRKEEALLKDADDKTVRWSSVWRSQWQKHSEDVYRWKNKCDRMENIREEIRDEYRNGLFRQTDMAIALTKISPFSVFRRVGDRVADNNYYGYRNFQSQVEAYRETFRSYINDKDAADPESLHLIWKGPFNNESRDYMSNTVIDPADIPVFTYRSPDALSIMRAALTDIAILLLWLFGLFGLVFYAFTRYDVR